MSLGLLRPCLTCGEASTSSRCEEHKALRARGSTRPSYRQRGYDGAWDRISRRARRRQPFCLDCGATTHLTTDHTPRAWARQQTGLPIRLADVEVVCRDCNSRRGSSRPGSRRYEEWEASHAAAAED